MPNVVPYSFDIKTIIDASYHEIEKIINEQYRNDLHKERYELPPIEERGSGDGETWEVNIRQEPIDAYDQKKLDDIKRGKWPQFCTRILLQDLCNAGLIPEGCYMIDISW